MREIALSNRKFAIVDDEDFEWLSKKKWTFAKAGSLAGYAMHHYKSGTKKHSLYMHRYIMNAPDGLQVDHINGNGLDNRRSNLRLCTATENLRNRGAYKGRSTKNVRKMGNKWWAFISINGRNTSLGGFPTERDAALAYNEAARQHFGEFARLNVVD